MNAGEIEAKENEIAGRLALLRERVAASAQRAGRNPEEIRLIGVTKTVGAERIAAAYRAGIREFGENYVQEAREKIPAVVTALSDALDGENDFPEWHFIGHLQSNKAKYAVELFSTIQTVDNWGLAEEIAKRAANKGQIQRILLEVNLARDPMRAGVLPEDAPLLAEKVAALPSVALAGLMGMAPFSADPEASRPSFRALRELYEGLPERNRQILSMGMSGDFEIAIEEGANRIRLGTALFGSRM